MLENMIAGLKTSAVSLDSVFSPESEIIFSL